MRSVENAIGMGVAWTITAAFAILAVWFALTSVAYVEALFGATSFVL